MIFFIIQRRQFSRAHFAQHFVQHFAAHRVNNYIVVWSAAKCCVKYALVNLGQLGGRNFIKILLSYEKELWGISCPREQLSGRSTVGQPRVGSPKRTRQSFIYCGWEPLCLSKVFTLKLLYFIFLYLLFYSKPFDKNNRLWTGKKLLCLPFCFIHHNVMDSLEIGIKAYWFCFFNSCVCFEKGFKALAKYKSFEKSLVSVLLSVVSHSEKRIKIQDKYFICRLKIIGSLHLYTIGKHSTEF